jgi:hypothetical protein
MQVIDFEWWGFLLVKSPKNWNLKKALQNINAYFEVIWNEIDAVICFKSASKSFTSKLFFIWLIHGANVIM